MKILITGASGLLGRYLLKTQPLRNDVPEGGQQCEHTIFPCYLNHPIENGVKVDVSKRAELFYTLLEIQPDLIIHCAANGDVDDVEDNPGEAVKSDLLGTINLKDYCEKMKIKLVTISTNAVYDGENPPYREGDKHYPVNFYGKIKSLADEVIRKSTCEWMIFRPIMLYGWPNDFGRGNWVTKIIDGLNGGKEIKLVTDSNTQPTYVGDVAKYIWKKIKIDMWGNKKYGMIWNVSSNETISFYEFGLYVQEVFRLPNNVNTAFLNDFPSIAPRPIDTSFFVQEPDQFSGVIEGLTLMKNE